MWRRPGLFVNLLEAVVWVAFSLAFLISSALAAVILPANPGLYVAGALLATHTLILWRKFGPRVMDMRSVTYRTVHGVAVIFRGMDPIPQIVIEAAHEEAIAAHGHPEALEGYALVVQRSPVYANAVRLMAVTDGGYMTVDASAYGGVFLRGCIRHEAARAILIAQGLSVAEQDVLMRAMGTY